MTRTAECPSCGSGHPLCIVSVKDGQDTRCMDFPDPWHDPAWTEPEHTFWCQAHRAQAAFHDEPMRCICSPGDSR